MNSYLVILIVVALYVAYAVLLLLIRAFIASPPRTLLSSSFSTRVSRQRRSAQSTSPMACTDEVLYSGCLLNLFV